MSSPEGPADAHTPFLEDYFAEAEEHLTSIRRHLLAAERRPSGFSAADLEELFRSFHSLKGLSGMVELREAELISHHIESYLRALRGRNAGATGAGLSALIEGTDALEQVIVSRRAAQAPPAIDRVVAQLEALLRETGPETGSLAAVAPAVEPGSEPRERWRALFAPSPELAARGIGVDRVRAMLREHGEIVEAVPRVAGNGTIRFEFVIEGSFDAAVVAEWGGQGLTLTPVTPPATTSAEERRSEAALAPPALLAPSHYVRVDLSRLDDLVRMIGDLVISRSRLVEMLSRVEQRLLPTEWRALQENAAAIERQLRDLREGVMRVRLVPVGEIFRRMPFVVRDLARETGKQIEVQTRGQDTEIDKLLIERMLDPVLHLVRNAVSHAIETPAERLASGKPAAGTITLSAASVGDVVMLEIADDGRGVDAEQVAGRARQLGLALPDGPLSGDALLEILCAPGFSTREAADRASGRGVGMAVVQTAVQELGGRLTLDTAPGQGTRFIIELPVTLAITDAILARVGGETFAIAQSAVREVVDVAPDTLRAIENNEIMPYRGGVLPIVRLAGVFGLEAQPHRTLHVFVVGHGLSAVGLAVDRILGQREIVVRTFADPLVKVDGVIGGTDLGDGQVVLILDAQRLAAGRRERATVSTV